jgi:hypothetical protein
MKRKIVLAVSLAILIASPAVADEWAHEFILYGWLSGLDGTIGVAGAGDVPVDASFSDLAGYLDFAMAGHFESHNAKAMFVADVSYVGLGAERDAMVDNVPVTIDMDLNQWIMEIGGGYRATPEIDVILVGRYYILDLGTTSTSIAGVSSSSNSQNWGDVYLGARYMKTLKEKWVVSARGDVGTGGSDFAWFGNVGVGYHFNTVVSAGVAYRVLSLDREPDAANSDYFKYDMTQDGLGIGVGFAF